MSLLISDASELISDIRDEQSANCPPSAAREFAIAITSIEEASMRIARGLALKTGNVITPQEVANATLVKAEESVHPDQLQLLEEESDLAESA